MIVTILKRGVPSGEPLPARGFACYDEKPGKIDGTHEITLSVEQADELAKWLNRELYGVLIRPDTRDRE